MKTLFFYLILISSIPNCIGQNKSNITPIGIGFLETNTSYPIPLYLSENDIIPYDVLEFKTREDGTTEFITKLKLKPYMISRGNSYEEGQENIDRGLVRFGPKLKFRVIDSTKNYFEVITNEDCYEIYYIKLEPHRVYYKSIRELHENNCSNCPNSKYNPNWYVFETWGRYLKRVEFITKRELKIYDKPKGEVIFNNNNNDFLPFNITKMSGDWVELKKGFGRGFNFDNSKNYEGWTQWKKGNKVLIEIIEHTFE